MASTGKISTLANGERSEMSTAVRELLSSYESLPQNDQHEATVAILRHVLTTDYDDVSDIALTAIADDLFRALDAAESDDAKR
jgi:hypothetical protein